MDQLLRRHAELRDALARTGLAGADFARSSKEYSELTPIVGGIERLRRAREELSSLSDIAESGATIEICDSLPRKSCGRCESVCRSWSSR